jgi:hypothetical protein
MNASGRGSRAAPSGPAWSPHPPDALRVIINLKTLELLNFEEDAGRLGAAWTQRFPKHAMTEFEGDIKDIVTAVLNGPYSEFGEASLTKVISFGSAEIAQANAVKKALAHPLPPTAPIRSIVAGMRLAFEANPVKFFEKKADEVVLATIRAAQTTAYRRKEDVEPLKELDTAAGLRMFETLKRMHSVPIGRQ